MYVLERMPCSIINGFITLISAFSVFFQRFANMTDHTLVIKEPDPKPIKG